MPACLCMGNGEKQSAYCFQRTRGCRTRVYMKYAFSGACVPLCGMQVLIQKILSLPYHMKSNVRCVRV